MASPSRLVGATFVTLLTSACLFPEYTFDETEPSGGAGAGTGGQAVGANGGGGSNQGAGPVGGDGGMGGMPPTEDCFTPGDEDDDGMADCADSDCTPDLECVEAIPVGWGTYGYTALFRGSPLSDPACPSGAGTEVYTGNGDLQNTEASCSQCDCDNPTGQGCVLNSDTFDPIKPGIQPFRTRNAACGAGATGLTTLTVPSPWDLACTALDTAPGGTNCGSPSAPCNTSVEVRQASVTAGSCTATGGEPDGGDATWGEGIKGCRAATNLMGCGGGMTCVPRPPPPFEPRVCIGKVGDVACPAGSFTLRSESFGGFTDSRTCSDCACGSSTGGTCKINVSFFSDAACSGAPIATVESNQCAPLAGNPTVAGRTGTITQQPTGGSCPVTGGGVASGEVTATTPTTFCCLPD